MAGEGASGRSCEAGGFTDGWVRRRVCTAAKQHPGCLPNSARPCPAGCLPCLLHPPGCLRMTATVPSLMLSPMDGTATVTSASAAAELLMPRCASREAAASNLLPADTAATAAQCAWRAPAATTGLAVAPAGRRQQGGGSRRELDGRRCRLPDRLLCLPKSHLSPPPAPQSPVCTGVQHPAGRRAAWAGNLRRSALLAALSAHTVPTQRPDSPERHTAAGARAVQSAATSLTAALPAAALRARTKPRRGLKGAGGRHAHP